MIVQRICSRIRPTFDEVMGMDVPLASAVLGELPSIDGADAILKALSKLAPR